MYQKRNGFTLIELLVVISIIALLLSILMPALNKVKEKAKIIVCKTNLHNIGLAIAAYATEYDDRLPDIDPSAMTSPFESAYQNHTWYLWGKDEVWPWHVNPRPLGRYIESEDVYECPADNRPNPEVYDSTGRTYTFYDYYGNSYPYNCAVLGNAAPYDADIQWNGVKVLWKNKYSKVPRPSHTVASGDVTSTTYMAYTMPNIAAYYLEFLIHDKKEPGTNLLFLDGHATYLTMPQMLPDVVYNKDYTLVLPGSRGYFD